MLYSRTSRNTCVELEPVAADLLGLTPSMLLTYQPELHHPEPTTQRYRLLHLAARITKAPAFTGRHLRQRG